MHSSRMLAIRRFTEYGGVNTPWADTHKAAPPTPKANNP